MTSARWFEALRDMAHDFRVGSAAMAGVRFAVYGFQPEYDDDFAALRATSPASSAPWVLCHFSASAPATTPGTRGGLRPGGATSEGPRRAPECAQPCGAVRGGDIGVLQRRRR